VSRPVVVWDTPPVRMVGREQEFTQLVDMLDRAEVGAGGFAVLTGEAGIGKTRLVTEWAAEARRRGFVVLMGRAIDSGGSLRPVAQALMEECGTVRCWKLLHCVRSARPSVASCQASSPRNQSLPPSIRRSCSARVCCGSCDQSADQERSCCWKICIGPIRTRGPARFPRRRPQHLAHHRLTQSLGESVPAADRLVAVA
jgi:hypothetical protein